VLKRGPALDWESYPDYLESLSQRRFDVDIAASFRHAALRVS